MNYVWKRRPKTLEGWRTAIARSLGIALVPGTGDAPVPAAKAVKLVARDRKTVRVRISQVYRHMVKDHPKRWQWIPLIRKVIERGIPAGGSPGEARYVARMRIAERGGSAATGYFFAAAREDPKRRRAGLQWRTFYDIKPGDYKKCTEEYAAGGQPAPATRGTQGTGIPAPSPLSNPGLSRRPGRQPGTSPDYTTSSQGQVETWGRLLAIAAGIALLGSLARRRDEAVA